MPYHYQRYLLACLALAVVSSTCSLAGEPESPRMIRAETIVAAPVADVWAAWTTKAGLTAFFAADANVELRVGGPYELIMKPDNPPGQRGAEGCTVLAFVPEQMLAFTWNVPPTIPALREANVHTQVVLTFEALGPQRTRVRLVNHGYGEGADWDAALAYFSKAWPFVLDNLTKHFGGEAASQPAANATFVYIVRPARKTFEQDATEAEGAIIREHVQYLKKLMGEGRLVLAGRTAQDWPMGFVIFEAADLAAAQQIMQGDPAVAKGVFTGEVAPYRIAFQRTP